MLRDSLRSLGYSPEKTSLNSLRALFLPPDLFPFPVSLAEQSYGREASHVREDRHGYRPPSESLHANH